MPVSEKLHLSLLDSDEELNYFQALVDAEIPGASEVREALEEHHCIILEEV